MLSITIQDIKSMDTLLLTEAIKEQLQDLFNRGLRQDLMRDLFNGLMRDLSRGLIKDLNSKLVKDLNNV